MAGIEFSKVLEVNAKGSHPDFQIAEANGFVYLVVTRDGQRCTVQLQPHEADTAALSMIKAALPAAQRLAQAKQGRPSLSNAKQNGTPPGGGLVP